MSLKSILSNLTIKALVKNKVPILVTFDTKVEKVIDVLRENNIHSVLVTNPNLGKDYVKGFVDVFDLVAWLIHCCKSSESLHPHNVSKQFFEAENLFKSKQVGDLCDKSDLDLFATVVEEESILRIIGLYALGVHRVGLVNVDGNVNAVVSQIDVLRFIYNNKNLLGGHLNRTVSQLPGVMDKISHADKGWTFEMNPSGLVKANSHDWTFYVFEKLLQNKISAVPIVDSLGGLVGTLSVFDVLNLSNGNFNLLLSNVMEFIQSNSMLDEKPSPIISFVCNPDDTIENLLYIFSSSQVHRIWVVGENGEPLSVVSLTDLCVFIQSICSVEFVGTALL